MEKAFVALGSNLGRREQYLLGAVDLLHVQAGVEVLAVSPVYEAPAHTLVPGEGQPPYLNAVVALATTLEPENLLEVCHRIERVSGRDRSQEPRWAPRTLDLDLLLLGDLVRSHEAPLLPHPRMAGRLFVLQPLADLAPEYKVPVFDKTVRELLAVCPDPHRPALHPFGLERPRD